MSYLDRDPYGMYRVKADKSGPGPTLMGAGTLSGEDVMNNKGEDLGDIKEFMIDMRSGKIAYAVLSFGGILGMGKRLFAVPWSALKLDTDAKCFRLDVAKADLDNAPGFDQDNWPSMADESWANSIHSYYKTKPDWQ
jgi:PRC-barrel domain